MAGVHQQKRRIFDGAVPVIQCVSKKVWNGVCGTVRIMYCTDLARGLWLQPPTIASTYDNCANHIVLGHNNATMSCDVQQSTTFNWQYDSVVILLSYADNESVNNVIIQWLRSNTIHNLPCYNYCSFQFCFISCCYSIHLRSTSLHCVFTARSRRGCVSFPLHVSRHAQLSASLYCTWWIVVVLLPQHRVASVILTAMEAPFHPSKQLRCVSLSRRSEPTIIWQISQ